MNHFGTITGCLLIAFTTSFNTLAEDTDTLKIFVSPDGNDKNPGTQNSPLKSLEKARDIIRQIFGEISWLHNT